LCLIDRTGHHIASDHIRLERPRQTCLLQTESAPRILPLLVCCWVLLARETGRSLSVPAACTFDGAARILERNLDSARAVFDPARVVSGAPRSRQSSPVGDEAGARHGRSSRIPHPARIGPHISGIEGYL